VDISDVYKSLQAAIDSVCDREIQGAIAREYRRQIVLRSEAGNTPASEWIIRALQVYPKMDVDLNGTPS
jgi:hypothetical protein